MLMSSSSGDDYRSALRLMRDDFGHDQHEVHKIIHELLAKLPDEASIRSIDITTGQ